MKCVCVCVCVCVQACVVYVHDSAQSDIFKLSRRKMSEQAHSCLDIMEFLSDIDRIYVFCVITLYGHFKS